MAFAEELQAEKCKEGKTCEAALEAEKYKTSEALVAKEAASCEADKLREKLTKLKEKPQTGETSAGIDEDRVGKMMSDLARKRNMMDTFLKMQNTINSLRNPQGAEQVEREATNGQGERWDG